MSEQAHVFVVDDDADVRDSLQFLLETAGLKVKAPQPTTATRPTLGIRDKTLRTLPGTMNLKIWRLG